MKRVIRGFDVDGELYEDSRNHQVIHMYLDNGEKYAIDLTGPQYGYYGEPVMPWELYKASRIAKIVKFSDCREVEHKLQERRRHLGHKGAIPTIDIHFAAEMYKAVSEWEKVNVELSVMLKHPEPTFSAQQAELIGNIFRHLSDHKKALESKGPTWYESLDREELIFNLSDIMSS